MSRVVKCPQCKAEVQWEDNPHRPFCSERCQLLDLGAWAEEQYRIPGAVVDDEDERKDPDSDDTFH